ncbi:hypothetical protein ABZ553_07190 [Streptomyces sparsogenes]|uniref:hypothetical protein n=1 Tax=Streptomyces sparsogenes TaxID=67365 RepID=UPI0033F9DA3D
MTEEIFPTDVMSAEAFDDAADIYLFAEERAAVAGAVPRRRRELSMGEIHLWCREYDLFHSGLTPAAEHGDNDGPVLHLPLMPDRCRVAGPLGGRCHVRGPAVEGRRPPAEWNADTPMPSPSLTAAFAAQSARTPDPTAPVGSPRTAR